MVQTDRIPGQPTRTRRAFAGMGSDFVPYTGAIKAVDLDTFAFTTTGLGTFGSLDTDSLIVGATPGGAITNIENETDLASDSDANLATQKAIKAYVDASLTGYIPYTGATDNVDLGVYNLETTGSLIIDTPLLVVNKTGYENRVGIGTATPGYTLHIQGTSTANSYRMMSSDTYWNPATTSGAASGFVAFLYKGGGNNSWAASSIGGRLQLNDGSTLSNGAGIFGGVAIAETQTGIIGAASCVEAQFIQANDGTIVKGMGFYVPANAATKDAGGTFTTYASIWLGDQNSGGATDPTTVYGIVIDSNVNGLTLGAGQDATLYYDGSTCQLNSSLILTGSLAGTYVDLSADALIRHGGTPLITTNASNQFIVGDASGPITAVFVGKGITSATPGDVTINTTGGVGTNIAAGDLILTGGISTGNADPGDIVFKAAMIGAWGETPQTPATIAKFNTETANFLNLDIETAGAVNCNLLSVSGMASISDFTLNNNYITANGTINFHDEHLTTTGQVGIGTAVDSVYLSPLYISHSVTMSGVRYVLRADAQITGAWTANEMRGLDFDINDLHSSGIGNRIIGISTVIDQQTSQNMTRTRSYVGNKATIRGLHATGGTVAETRGYHARHYFYGTSTGTWSDSRGFNAEVDAEDGAITKYTHFYGELPAVDGGSIGTFSHIWLEDATVAGTNYGIVIDSDTIGITFGAGQDATLYYDGSALSIVTNTVAASDLDINCGTNKTLELQETVYKDINVGGVVLPAIPAAAPGKDEFVDSTGTDTGVETYAVAVGEGVDGSFELQHDYAEGTDLVFHVHWQGITAPTGTDNVQWQLTYTLAHEEVVLTAATIITIETGFDVQYEFKRSDFAAIDGTNFQIGDQFLFRLERIAASANEYGGDALLATVGVHYEVDTIGSRQITTK